MTSFGEEIKQLEKMIGEFKQVDCSKEKGELPKLENQLQALQIEFRQKKVALIEMGARKISLEGQLSKQLEKRQQLHNLMRKVLPAVDFELLRLAEQEKI